MAVSNSVDVKPRAKMTKLVKNNKKPSKKVLLIAQELKFAKTLAGNNKTLRDRALKRLKKWFDARENQMPFTENDFMRVWKGLHYYMWMSDKPLTQEECATNISKLINFKNEETSLLFFKCFLQTMINEWFGIDHLRLDKFLMLVRRVLRQALTVLSQSDWEMKHLTYFQDILNETVLKLDSTVPLSFNMHITEIYLEELAKVSKGKLSEDQVLEFLRPFAWHLAHSKDARQSQHIKNHIFRYLMRQSDAGLEYQERFNAWRQLGFPGGTIESMEKVELDEDNLEDAMENDMDETMENDSPLDPRAGKVHVELKQLKFDPAKIADMLEDLKYKPSTNTKSRRALVALAEQFKELANGNYPLGMKKIRTKPKNNGPSINMKSSLKRLQNFERQILGNSKKAKSARQKSRKIREIVNKELEKYKNMEDQKPASSMDEFVARSEEGIFSTELVKNNTKKSTPPTEKTPKESKKRKNKSSEKAEKRFKRNSGVWKVDELESSVLNSSSTSDWEEEKLEKPKNKPQKIKKSKVLPVIVESETVSNGLKVKGKKSPNKGVELLLTPTKSPKAKNSSTPLVKNPFSTPVSSTKKVKIALNLNRSQDHREYHQSLVSSPGIPYDAARKPMKPLLKPKAFLQDSINPFYKN